MKTALWGSYCWRREHDVAPDESALLGMLPELDYNDPWSIARAQLFTEEELYNDLPENWEPAALAYYRGKNNQWYQFRKTSFGDAFYKLAYNGKPEKLLFGRYIGQREGLKKLPTWIPGWPAYKDNRPIGLNPDRNYNFLLGKPQKSQGFEIVGMPDNVYISAVRPAKGWTVIEFNSSVKTMKTISVAVSFSKSCAGIAEYDKKLKGPIPAGKIVDVNLHPVNGSAGMVIVWDKIETVNNRRRAILHQKHGKLYPNGLPDTGFWYNSGFYQRDCSVGGKKYPSIYIGPGRARGYAEAWVELVANSKTGTEVFHRLSG